MSLIALAVSVPLAQRARGRPRVLRPGVRASRSCGACCARSTTGRRSALLSVQADLQSLGNALFGITDRAFQLPWAYPALVLTAVSLGLPAVLRAPRAGGGDRAVTAHPRVRPRLALVRPGDRAQRRDHDRRPRGHRPARSERGGEVDVPQAGRGPARAQPGRGARARQAGLGLARAVPPRRPLPGAGRVLGGTHRAAVPDGPACGSPASTTPSAAGARSRPWSRSPSSSAKDRKIGGYSKGMRQRVKLAQALAHDPEVLLLDEPLSGMDPVNRRRVVDLVKRLGREGRTVVVSSHILHEVEAMTRRVLLIHNGRILAEGDVREIRDLMDEHPHTVALRARDPRALARAVVGSPHVLSLSVRRGRGVADRADGAAGRVLRRRCRARRWRPASARCTRRTRTWSPSSSTWWRGERDGRARPDAAGALPARRAAPSSTSRSRGWSGAGAAS